MTTRDIRENGVDVPSNRTTVEDECPECGTPLVSRNCETSCPDCGLVVAEDRIDRGPEWREFDGEDTGRKRTGWPRTAVMHDRGLSTEIGFTSELSGRERRRMARLRRHNKRAKFASKGERNLAKAFGEIARVVSALELPRSIREMACEVYRQAQSEDLIIGRSIEMVASASVYAACRCCGTPRTLAEIAEVSQCERSEIRLSYRVLNEALGLAARVVDPGEYVPRIASAVDAPDRVRHRSHELAAIAKEAGLANGRNPAGVAAACVYLAGHEAGQLYTQQQLAAIADVTPTTLRNRYKELEEQLR